MKHITKSLAAVLLAALLTMPVFAQETVTDVPKPTETASVEATVEPVPVVEPAPEETVAIDPNLMTLIVMGISMVSVTVVSVFAVIKSGGTAQEAIKAGATTSVRSVISNEGLSTTIEERLKAIPQHYRNFLMELVNLASPITETSTISKDGAQWIKNVLDGSLETGAIPFTASSTSESPLQAAVVPTPNKNDSAVFTNISNTEPPVRG